MFQLLIIVVIYVISYWNEVAEVETTTHVIIINYNNIGWVSLFVLTENIDVLHISISKRYFGTVLSGNAMRKVLLFEMHIKEIKDTLHVGFMARSK